ncbi:hypothetical protein Agub_g1233 [Astrephomene gubernaculifera]|uniref:Uncharacterized protein n=1 Tax=Astrephomene gubernaculifera TaxID=47775 RepID=A0AAD3DFI1_9CHLO|nr:hypothetical protein Agub_g1233 [Astrephomene gubernaculifera]
MEVDDRTTRRGGSPRKRDQASGQKPHLKVVTYAKDASGRLVPTSTHRAPLTSSPAVSPRRLPYSSTDAGAILFQPHVHDQPNQEDPLTVLLGAGSLTPASWTHEGHDTSSNVPAVGHSQPVGDDHRDGPWQPHGHTDMAVQGNQPSLEATFAVAKQITRDAASQHGNNSNPPPLPPPSPLQLPAGVSAHDAAVGAAELVGGRPVRDVGPARPGISGTRVQSVALPAQHGNPKSGTARARQEIFHRRGRLTRELTELGLPPVYMHHTNLLVGKQVLTGAKDASAASTKQPQDQQQQPAWRKLRQQALDPAHNPVMARNVRLKAQLAQHAARGAAAVAAAAAAAAGAGAGKARHSSRALRHASAVDEASRTISKLQVVDGTGERRMGSAPVSKPYYPRRRRGGVPANETEGGDMMPGRLARLVAQQVAEEQALREHAIAASTGQPRKVPTKERRRQAQIQALADAIVAAPQLGIRELGVYLPHELTLPAPSCTATTAAHDVAEDASSTPLAALEEALRLLERSAAAARATVAAAEDDYGSFYPRGSGAADVTADEDANPSPAASSYGSGGHYLYEEGLAEDEDSGEDGSTGNSSCWEGDRDGSEGGGVKARAQGSPPGGNADDVSPKRGSLYPDAVALEANPGAGVTVVRYPASDVRRRQWAQMRSPDRGVQAARSRMEQVHSAQAAAVMPFDLTALRRADARLANEVTGGRMRKRPGSAVEDSTSGAAPAASSPPAPLASPQLVTPAEDAAGTGTPGASAGTPVPSRLGPPGTEGGVPSRDDGSGEGLDERRPFGSKTLDHASADAAAAAAQEVLSDERKATPGLQGSRDWGPSLERFGMTSDDMDAFDEDQDDEDEGRRGQARHEGRQSMARADAGGGSGSDDGDSRWGVEDADELGYPLAFGCGPPKIATPSQPPSGDSGMGGNTARLAAMTGATATRCDDDGAGHMDDDGAGSTGSWGIQQGPIAVAVASKIPPRYHAAPTPPGAQGHAVTSTPPVHPETAGGAAARGGLLAELGLVSEAPVVDPHDIPPLQFTPPPAWMLGPREEAGEADRQAASDWKGNKAIAQDLLPRSPHEDNGQAHAVQEEHVSGAQRPVGRVEAALAQAKERMSFGPVRYDDMTFHFTDPPRTSIGPECR